MLFFSLKGYQLMTTGISPLIMIDTLLVKKTTSSIREKSDETTVLCFSFCDSFDCFVSFGIFISFSHISGQMTSSFSLNLSS